MSDAAAEEKPAEGEEAKEGAPEEAKAEEKPPEATPFDKALEPVKAWLDPIPGDDPAGEDAKYDTNYEKLREEVGKLDSPRGEEIDWKFVRREGETITQEKSKDILIVVNTVYAMIELEGFPAIGKGLALLIGLMETYWENMHPPKKRMRGRVGALVWYLERLNVVLPAQKLQAKDRPAVEELKVIAEKFREVVFEKFEDQAPALGPLKDNIERILIGLPQEKPKPKPPEKKPAPAVAAAPAAQDGGDGGGGEAAPAAAASSAPAAGMPAAPAASMGSPEDLGKYMRDIGMSMLDAGKKLRKAQATSPEAYRLIRLGMWLEILQPPPIQPDGNTMIPGLPDALRQKLNALDSGQTWPQLLDEAESSMLTNRLNLDLQRYALKAMGGLGPAYDNVRKACINALRDLLDRLPAILRLSCKDGSLLADQNTKEWIKEEILTSGGGGEGGGGGGGGGSAIPQKELAEAKKLASGGKPADAMAIFEKLIGGASDGRSRFQIRLAQADVARRANNIPVARAMFESLDEEARALNLERWEPGLVVECLVGYLSCLRASRQKGEVSPEEVALYRRLAQLKPSLAVEMGT